MINVLKLRFGFDDNIPITLEEIGKIFDVIKRTHKADRGEGSEAAETSGKEQQNQELPDTELLGGEEAI